jgi:hypothetical protein
MEKTTKNFTDPITRDKNICSRIKETLDADKETIIECYLNNIGKNSRETLRYIMNERSRHFILAGVDLMAVENRETGERDFLLLEINSAPGFIYCTPENDAAEYGYKRLIHLLLDHTPKDQWDGIVHFSEGKVPVEDRGFFHYYREILKRDVNILGPRDLEKLSLNRENQLEYRGRPITGAIRYIHKDPWNYLAPSVKGTFINSTKVDLCGGRDKLMAERAFDSCIVHNKKIVLSRPECFTAHTREELEHIILSKEFPLVVKKRFLNSGIGIYFILNKDLSVLKELSDKDFPIVVQQMIIAPGTGINSDFPWEQKGVCIEGKRYAYDLRVVVASGPDGYKPLMVYGRRGRRPFSDLKNCGHGTEIFDDIFKVNIAKKKGSDFVFESNRLILPTDEGWEMLGITESELMAAYMESILSLYAADRFCDSYEGRFDELLAKFLT